MIEAVGWTLLHFLWQGALIGALFGLSLATLRVQPQLRYLSGCLSLLAMLGAVAATFAYHYEAVSEETLMESMAEAESPGAVPEALFFKQCRICHSSTDATAGNAPTGSPARGVTFRAEVFSADNQCPGVEQPATLASAGASPDEGEAKEAKAGRSLFFWLVRIWLAGVTILSLRFLVSWGVAQRLRGRGIVTTDEFFTQRLRRIAERVGVTRPVRILKSAAVTVPTVVGWLRPVILIPVASLAGLSRSQLEAVLAHELAHIRRHDYLVNLLQHAVETLFFFHPAVWWVSKKVREEREHCCDDIAAGVAGNALNYARALATLEEQRSSRYALGMAANGGSLLARIRRLCGVERPPRLPLIALPSLLLLMAALIPLAMVYSQEPAQTNAEPVASADAAERALTPEESLQGLRHLLAKPPESEASFSDFVLLARALDEKSIGALLGEIGMRPSDGHRAWARSALYSEWARRDLNASLTHFRENFKNWRGIREQVPHALYVGSRPVDPWAALAYLRGLPDDPRFRFNFELNRTRAPMIYRNADWVKKSFKRLFAELAAIDSERAWKELPGRGGKGQVPLNHNKLLTTNHAYESMVDGFFAGLKDRKTFEQFVERFGPVGEPGTEPVAIAIAKNWMGHDIAAAQAWAPPERQDPFVANFTYGVEGNAARAWARENPADALQAIRDKVLPKWNHLMATSLLKGNPHLASELVALLGKNRTALPPPVIFLRGADGKPVKVTPAINVPPKEGTPPGVWYALKNSMRVEKRDAFPEPGRTNRILDHRARYESYRAAIASDVFSVDEQTKLRVHLDAVFGNVLELPSPDPKNQK